MSTRSETDLIEIDGSFGEGGGQVLRTSLTMSVATGRPLRVVSIRAGRPKPGLMRQHLTSVRAAAKISDARVTGDELGSTEILFAPRTLRAGSYEFSIGTAGSCMLVSQTIVPALLRADGPSTIALEGGTHNPAAPPWELIERAYFPALAEMGADVSGRLECHGFMPAGGGRVVVEVKPGASRAYVKTQRTDILNQQVEAVFANLNVDIARRELAVVGKQCALGDEQLLLREVKSQGPGNALILTIEHDAGREVIAEFGVRGRSAEVVARSAAREAKAFLATNAVIGRHLADQLLVPMTLRGGGRFTTVKPSRHTVTNAEVIRKFCPGSITISHINEAGSLRSVEVTPMNKQGLST
ncbi:MAG: RNA 3'-terminal phosphate cyclase [Pseudomonadota bacterium]